MTITKQLIKHTLEQLLIKGSPVSDCDKQYGLCTVLFRAIGNFGIPPIQFLELKATTQEWLESQFETWEEYSKVTDYPVPAPEGSDYRPHGAYGHLDKWCGEYGASRLRLVKHLLDNIEELPE